MDQQIHPVSLALGDLLYKTFAGEHRLARLAVDLALALTEKGAVHPVRVRPQVGLEGDVAVGQVQHAERGREAGDGDGRGGVGDFAVGLQQRRHVRCCPATARLGPVGAHSARLALRPWALAVQ